MDKDNVISFYKRELFEDPLTDLIRNGIRQLIALAVEAEVNELMAKYDGQHTETGHRALLGAQDGECVECASEVGTAESEGGIARDLDGRDSSRCTACV